MMTNVNASAVPVTPRPPPAATVPSHLRGAEVCVASRPAVYGCGVTRSVVAKDCMTSELTRHDPIIAGSKRSAGST
jgi:hypothetical protein